MEKRNSEFRNILNKTREVCDAEVENALYQKALKGDVTAMIFWLKNRKYRQWRDKQVEIEEETNEGGIIEIPMVEEE